MQTVHICIKWWNEKPLKITLMGVEPILLVSNHLSYKVTILFIDYNKMLKIINRSYHYLISSWLPMLPNTLFSTGDGSWTHTMPTSQMWWPAIGPLPFTQGGQLRFFLPIAHLSLHLILKLLIQLCTLIVTYNLTEVQIFVTNLP